MPTQLALMHRKRLTMEPKARTKQKFGDKWRSQVQPSAAGRLWERRGRGGIGREAHRAHRLASASPIGGGQDAYAPIRGAALLSWASRLRMTWRVTKAANAQ